MILLFTSNPHTARWTPFGNWLLVATLVWQGAPYTGTSLNPARSLAPALLAPLLAHLWVYLAGPTAGALLAVAIFALFRDAHILTAKLFHDSRYPSTLGTELPTAIAKNVSSRQSRSRSRFWATRLDPEPATSGQGPRRNGQSRHHLHALYPGRTEVLTQP